MVSEDFTIGEDYDLDGMLKQFGANLAQLPPIEQVGIKRKVRSLYDARKKNIKLSLNVAKLEMVEAQKPGLPTHVPIFLKIYDDSTSRNSILKVTSNASAEELTQLAQRTLQKEPLLRIQISPTKTSVLSPESLLEAHSSICSGEQQCLILLAM
jgi:hypothetical protein